MANVLKLMKITSLPFLLWGQNGKELKPGKNCRIYSTGRKRFCQIMQCSRADSGTYTCDTGEINTSCSLEVYGLSEQQPLQHKLQQTPKKFHKGT